MKRVLITGATGFIGNALTHKLLSEGVMVIALVHKGSRNTTNLPKHELLKLYEVDMSDYANVDQIIKERNFDVLYHLAWQGVSGSKLTNVDVQTDNIKWTTNLMYQCHILGVKKFIGAGSLHEIEYTYENDKDEYSELQLNNLGNIYKISKIAAHGICKLIAKKDNIDFSWPIITNTYGEGERSKRLITSLIDSILEKKDFPLTSGEQLYDFVYITDVAEAFYLIGENGKSFKNYVIGSGVPQLLKQYLIELRDIVDTSYILKLGLKELKGVCLPKEVYDTTMLYNDTGFLPKITFSKGILLTLKDKEISI